MKRKMGEGRGRGGRDGEIRIGKGRIEEGRSRYGGNGSRRESQVGIREAWRGVESCGTERGEEGEEGTASTRQGAIFTMATITGPFPCCCIYTAHTLPSLLHMRTHTHTKKPHFNHCCLHGLQ